MNLLAASDWRSPTLSWATYGPCWDVIPGKQGQTSAKTSASCVPSYLNFCSILLFKCGKLPFFNFQSTLSEKHASRICISSTQEPRVDETEFPSFPFETQSRTPCGPAWARGLHLAPSTKMAKGCLGRSTSVIRWIWLQQQLLEKKGDLSRQPHWCLLQKPSNSMCLHLHAALRILDIYDLVWFLAQPHEISKSGINGLSSISTLFHSAVRFIFFIPVSPLCLDIYWEQRLGPIYFCISIPST